MTRMLIVGPAGSGKGTQSKRISEELGIVAISTGDIFRANIKGQTELGQEAQKYVDAGELVPDSVTNRMVEDRLSWEDAQEGFLLDGYPRNRTQVTALDEMLSRLGVELDVVLELTADREELTQRLKRRAEIEGREDDADEDAIRRRLELFQTETAPMISAYDSRGLLRQVDGLGAIDEVNSRIMEAIRS
ncbi:MULTISPECIES: adenylate kinase [Nesterenkonia]|uniref:Adenylate kinase n=1 Tax=Nesterenkonia xinjiangensis TaxID=225327 RepID=A0A7Z0GK22_9MICC|nr:MULTISPECIES: adenylate kinase [Nesterenkonia]MDZ5076556.1 adenylate kinase [Nesterenkonia sp. HG001]NYJ77382.1 adenylate kinase [Nesterenkonia xinjiangensis]